MPPVGPAHLRRAHLATGAALPPPRTDGGWGQHSPAQPALWMGSKCQLMGFVTRGGEGTAQELRRKCS